MLSKENVSRPVRSFQLSRGFSLAFVKKQVNMWQSNRLCWPWQIWMSNTIN